jgi:hypothetical protein
MLNLDYKDVAEKYGGNKQKIAQAVAMGALGPNGALLGLAAGDYIDTMRAAAVQEQVPQQTVAQRIFGPQPPMSPQGLGALPAPSQGMPPAAAPAPAPMQEQPTMSMAEGGMVPPYASGGGLSDLPVPDGMFDEPSNGGFNDGYAGGGLIAFADGGSTDDMPSTFYGYSYNDPTANLAIRDKLFGMPQTKYEQEAEADYLRRRGADYRKAQQKKDIGQLMAEAGFGMMAGNSPNALQNIGAALIPAISSATERAKERRAEEREIQRGLLDLEQGKNTRDAQRAAQALEMQGIGIKGAEGEVGRRFSEKQAKAEREYDWKKFLLNESGENYRAGIRAAADGAVNPKVNMASDDVVVQGRGNRPDVVVPRMRVTQRGSDQYWYQFPALGDVAINPAHGGYGLGVNNAMQYAQTKGLGLGVSQTGRLQFVGRDGKARTIPDEKLRKLNEAGARFDPKTYKY